MKLSIQVLAVLLTLGAMIACARMQGETDPTPHVSAERGRYLVTTMMCNDCHTPQTPGPRGLEPDMTRMLSGHPQDLKLPPAPALPPGPWVVSVAGTLTAWAGPWGTSFTANLTPDEETGIGKWTEQDFLDTLRNGRHRGRGREILPPMPYRYIAQLTDDDLRSVYAYLKTIPAVLSRRGAY